MIIAWIILGILGTFAIGERVFRAYVVPKIRHIFENVPPFNVVPEPEDPAARPISFQSAQGLTLRGCILNADIPKPLGLVLFLPELGGTYWSASRYCQALLKQGFVVISFDFRNQGRSDSDPAYSPIHWMTEHEMRDVEAALQFVESDTQLRTLPLIAFGVSRGGVAALLTGCRSPKIRCVIADSAFGTMAMIRYFVDRFVKHVIPEWVYRLLPKWHVDVTLWQAVALSEKKRRCQYAHLEKERRALDAASVLLISGSRDSYVTPAIASQLHRIVGNAAELWIAQGAKHNMSRLVQPEEYDRRVVAHVMKCLGMQSAASAEPTASPDPAMTKTQTDDADRSHPTGTNSSNNSANNSLATRH